MGEKSEKLQEITKHLDENSQAIQEQREEYQRLTSGISTSEKPNLDSIGSDAILKILAAHLP